MKLQDMEIIAQIEQQESIAYGVNDSSLSNDRATAIDYYLGQHLVTKKKVVHKLYLMMYKTRLSQHYHNYLKCL